VRTYTSERVLTQSAVLCDNRKVVFPNAEYSVLLVFGAGVILDCSVASYSFLSNCFYPALVVVVAVVHYYVCSVGCT
jgi:hypothetical protein